MRRTLETKEKSRKGIGRGHRKSVPVQMTGLRSPLIDGFGLLECLGISQNPACGDDVLAVVLAESVNPKPGLRQIRQPGGRNACHPNPAIMMGLQGSSDPGWGNVILRRGGSNAKGESGDHESRLY
jgi:hypothetical protein